MADDTLRLLARRFAETGALNDEVAWLQGRVRAGELCPRQIALAACLGHRAAQKACGAARPPRAFVKLVTRLQELARPSAGEVEDPARAPLGTQLSVRAGVSVARAVLSDRVGDHSLEPDFEGLREDVAQVEAWLLEPLLERRADFRDRMRELAIPRSSHGDPRAQRIVLGVLRLVVQGNPCATRPAETPPPPQSLLLDLCELGKKSLGATTLVAAFSDELTPWLLAGDDSVRDRVEARQGD